MRRLFPGRFEFIVFFCMAAAAGLIVANGAHHGASLFFVTLPIFLVSSLMGLRRKLLVQEVEIPEEPAAAE